MPEFADLAITNFTATHTPLSQRIHLACRRNDLEQVQALLANGADVNAVSKEGTTPLFEAIEGGNGPLIELLLQSGAHLGVDFALGA